MPSDITKTQPLPVVETLADIHRDDPERIFSHRRADVTDVSWTDHGERRSVPYRPAREWSPAALDRLLTDLHLGG